MSERSDRRHVEVGIGRFTSPVEEAVRREGLPTLEDQIRAALLRELPAMAARWAAEYGPDTLYAIDGPTREGNRIALRLVPARSVEEHDRAVAQVAAASDSRI